MCTSIVRDNSLQVNYTIRTERTEPTSPAVSAHTEGGSGRQNAAASQHTKSVVKGLPVSRKFSGVLTTNVPAPSGANVNPLCSIVTLPITLESDTIFGFTTLHTLLQPQHKYFENKQAYITEFASYKLKEDSEHFLLYPKVKGDTQYATKNNPFRKYQLSRAHAGATVGLVKGVIDTWHLDDFRLASPVFTMPAEMSQGLAERGERGRQIAWSLFRKFYLQDIPQILGMPGAQFGALVNLHVWKTSNPLQPHFHFHVLLSNHALINSNDLYDEEGKPGQVLSKWFGKGIMKQCQNEKTSNIRRGYVPFSDTELLSLKIAWTKRLRASCKRNGIECSYFNNPDGLAEVYVDFVTWSDGIGKAKFIHKINYQRRNWIEDYTKYTVEHPDCDNPPQWLEGYQNKGRPFGWWCNLSTLGFTEDDKSKLSPFDCEPMVYIGATPLTAILGRSEGVLAGLEMVKGVPVVTQLNIEDLTWLRTVEYKGAFSP